MFRRTLYDRKVMDIRCEYHRVLIIYIIYTLVDDDSFFHKSSEASSEVAYPILLQRLHM